jgi:hypothetical protein
VPPWWVWVPVLLTWPTTRSSTHRLARACATHANKAAPTEIVILTPRGSVLAFGPALARWRPEVRGFEAPDLVLQALRAALLGFVVIGVALTHSTTGRCRDSCTQTTGAPPRNSLGNQQDPCGHLETPKGVPPWWVPRGRCQPVSCGLQHSPMAARRDEYGLGRPRLSTTIHRGEPWPQFQSFRAAWGQPLSIDRGCRIRARLRRYVTRFSSPPASSWSASRTFTISA